MINGLDRINYDQLTGLVAVKATSIETDEISYDEKKSDTPNNPEVNTQQVTTPEEEQFTPLTEENLEKHTGTTNQQPALTKNQLKYQKSQAVLAQAKQEYKDAGGKDSIILAPSYRNLGSIRASTILLQNESAKSTKKKGNKKKII